LFRDRRDQQLIDYLLAAGATPNSKTRDVAARLGLAVGDGVAARLRNG
jgi:hypothetical protein